jgi:glycosyltransferase involved in cell wall biosynthesis
LDLDSRTPTGSDAPYFTVFIPSYNRAVSLDRTMESVERSNFGDVEVLLVDDGSTDNTKELAERWRSKASFKMVYIHQENRGKIGAHNTALEHARGLFFITLDAGDLLLPDGLEKIRKSWGEIPTEQRGKLAGIGALCVREDGRVAGRTFPEEGKDASYLDMLKYTGEKRYAILTSVMKSYPYPIVPGEKHVRPDLILKRMAHNHKFRFLNIPIQVNVREPDGITANIILYRMNNPGGFRLYFLEEITLHRGYYDSKKRFSDLWRYIRYSLHTGVGLREQAREMPHLLPWLLALPLGILKWMTDKGRFLYMGKRDS